MSHSVASPVNGYYGRYQAEVHKSYVGAAPERPHGAGAFDRAARPDGATANSAAPHAQASFSAITDMLRELNNMITTLSARMGGQQHRTLPATKLIPDQTRSVLQPHSPPLERSALGVDSGSDVPETPHRKFIRGNAENAGIKPTHIWGAFSQEGVGNCVTVSAIKAAMAKFGHNPHGIYKQITEVKDGFEVTMRDSFKLHISFEELEEAQEGAGLRPGHSEDVLINAQFLYAVSAKRAQLENNDGDAEDSFEDAMVTLADGELAGEGLIRLGLRAHMAPTTVRELAEGAIGVLCNGPHQMAVVDGALDMWGTKTSVYKDFHWRYGAKLI